MNAIGFNLIQYSSRYILAQLDIPFLLDRFQESAVLIAYRLEYDSNLEAEHVNTLNHDPAFSSTH